MSDHKQIAPDILLDKVMALYPYGIPRDVVRRPPPAVSVNNEDLCPQSNGHTTSLAVATKCIFYVVSATELSTSEQELLSAIAEKGLRIQPSDYHVVVVSTLDAARQAVSKLKQGGAARVVLVFGTSTPSPDISKVGGLWVLSTYAVAEVGANAETKKAFWQHLKGLLPIISTR